MFISNKIIVDVMVNKSAGSGAIVGADLAGRTIIGSHNVIGHHAVVGAKCQDLKYKVSCRIIMHSMKHANAILLCTVPTVFFLSCRLR